VPFSKNRADVAQPEFGIEKRVHVDKMPVHNTVFDEHQDILSLYWTSQDVLSFVAETTDEPHLLKIKALGAGDARLLSGDGSTLSKQSRKSAARSALKFDGLRSTPGGHKVQDIKELMALPVIVMSDITKSPPVLVVYACELCWSNSREGDVLIHLIQATRTRLSPCCPDFRHLL